MGMTKSKSSGSSMVVPSIFLIHLINSAQFLNATRAAMPSAIVILPFTNT